MKNHLEIPVAAFDIDRVEMQRNIEKKMLGMKNHFDISGSIEIREVDIAGVACSSLTDRPFFFWYGWVRGNKTIFNVGLAVCDHSDAHVQSLNSARDVALMSEAHFSSTYCVCEQGCHQGCLEQSSSL